MKNPPKIKRVNLDMLEKIQHGYGGKYGLYAYDTNTIYLESSLTDRTIPSKQAVTQHEIAHVVVHRARLKLTKRIEEKFCELYSLVASPDKSISETETVAKNVIFGDLKWTRVIDREEILIKILEICGVKQPVQAAEKILTQI